jgi:cytoskeletal protein RodZ
MTERDTSVETRESVGQVLKKGREAKNLSLQDVAKHTRISEQVLTAIEEDRYDLLPPDTYVRGFLSAYAKLLGIDPNDVIQRYHGRHEVKPSPAGETPAEEKIVQKRRNRWILWGVPGVILVCFILFYFVLPLSPPPPQPGLPVSSVTEEKPSPAPPKPDSSVSPPAKEQPPVAPPQPAATVARKEEARLSLQLRAVEETWIRIHINDQTGKEMILKPGEAASFQASDQIRLLIGNAGGLDLIQNGKALDKTGKSGEVVTVIFTPQGVEIKPHGNPKPGAE